MELNVHKEVAAMQRLGGKAAADEGAADAIRRQPRPRGSTREALYVS